MNQPKVSVIIPLYNKAPYVKKTLDSIAAQTYTDYECIIVNDGSTDDSLEVVNDWLNSSFHHSINSSFRLITQPNAGVSSARNRGIAESKGDYLAFLDADDWWAPTFLEEMVQLTNDYPKAGIYASNYIYYKPGKMRVGVKQVYGVQCTVYNEVGWSGYINYPKSYYVNGEQVVWTGAVLLDKRKLYGEMAKWKNGRAGEVFNTQVKLGEDFLLWLRLSLSYPVAFLNKPLAYYNNELSGSLRLTGKLHKPVANMLWHMDSILDSYSLPVFVDVIVVNKDDWKKLFDRERVKVLYSYWLSNEYHDAAKEELRKVDWTILNDWSEFKKYNKLYQLPVWLLRWRQDILLVGSYWKQQVVKLINA